MEYIHIVCVVLEYAWGYLHKINALMLGHVVVVGLETIGLTSHNCPTALKTQHSALYERFILSMVLYILEKRSFCRDHGFGERDYQRQKFKSYISCIPNFKRHHNKKGKGRLVMTCMHVAIIN